MRWFIPVLALWVLACAPEEDAPITGETFCEREDCCLICNTAQHACGDVCQADPCPEHERSTACACDWWEPATCKDSSGQVQWLTQLSAGRHALLCPGADGDPDVVRQEPEWHYTCTWSCSAYDGRAKRKVVAELRYSDSEGAWLKYGATTTGEGWGSSDTAAVEAMITVSAGVCE